MTNDERFDEALAAINSFFFDHSVSQNETRIGLIDLRDQIDMLLESMET